MKKKSAKTYKDLFELNLKYISYLLDKSLLSHQYIRNINLSGSNMEEEVREIFRNLLPKRFHVTHGYIVYAPNKDDEPIVSSQIDMIIVDTMVPHSIFIADKKSGMEIVPKEAVLGIFEIKRTLNHASLIGSKKNVGALEHLAAITSNLSITKTETARYITGGLKMGSGIKGGYCGNPIIGIIGITHSKPLIDFRKKKKGNDIGQILKKTKHVPQFDIICSLDGFMYALGDPKDPENFLLANPWLKTEKYSYKLLKRDKGLSQAHAIASILGYIGAYLQSSCAPGLDFNNYFFNKNV